MCSELIREAKDNPALLFQTIMTPSVWDYVFTAPIADMIADFGFLRAWFIVVLCRALNHPLGTVFYSSGYEPDHTCKGCGDWLG